AQLDRLLDFMASGKGVVVAFSTIASDLQSSPELTLRSTGIVPWLEGLGVKVAEKVVVDASCGQVQVVQQRGMFNVQTAVAFPYFPLVTNMSEHPITSGLEAVVLQFASPVAYVGDSSFTAAPLFRTSDRSNSLSLPHLVDLQKQWRDQDLDLGPQALGLALEGPFGGGPGARMVVLGSGSFAVDRQGQGQPLNPDNVNLLVNAVDWVTDSTGLIELRSKGITYRPIDELTDAERTTIKWTQLLLPILLVVGIGVGRKHYRRRQRKARMRPGHVE
ncbi:MAG: hypothetical protein KDB88_09605, partial [Flavobacteriales bacterium]|nr:hypothetical protein [Flavobacteriales bacterium]